MLFREKVQTVVVGMSKVVRLAVWKYCKEVDSCRKLKVDKACQSLCFGKNCCCTNIFSLFCLFFSRGFLWSENEIVRFSIGGDNFSGSTLISFFISHFSCVPWESRLIPRLFFETKCFRDRYRDFFRDQMFSRPIPRLFWDQIFSRLIPRLLQKLKSKMAA